MSKPHRPKEIELALERTARAVQTLSTEPYVMPWDVAADFGRLRAYIVKMEAALTPFAKAAAGVQNPKTIIAETPSSEKPNYYLTGADLHAARDCFKADQQQQDQ